MKKWLIGVAMWGMSTVGFAGIKEADQLFAKRQNTGNLAADRAVVTQIRQAYQAALVGLNGADLTHVVTRLTWLDLFEGELLLPKSAREERKRVLRPCWERTIESLNPQRVGDNPAYYYWKGVCMGYYGEAVGPSLETLTLFQDMKRILEAGKRFNQAFEGGGFLRIEGGMRTDRLSRNPLLSYYDFDRGMALLNQAIEQPAYDDSPDALSGADYYDNHRYKAAGLMEAGRLSEAKTFLQETIDEITAREADGALPKGREVETLFYRDTFKTMLKSL